MLKSEQYTIHWNGMLYSGFSQCSNLSYCYQGYIAPQWPTATLDNKQQIEWVWQARMMTSHHLMRPNF